MVSVGRSISRRFVVAALGATIFAVAACAPARPQNLSGNKPEVDDSGQEPTLQSAAGVVAQPARPETESFVVPLKENDALAGKYAFLDPRHLVPAMLLAKAIAYYDLNQNKLTNKKYLTIVDFAQYSGRARFFLIDMLTGQVNAFHVAHGSGSDPRHTGYAKLFGNSPGSNMSSLGFYLTAEDYYGTHGLSLRLDGLSSTNSNARGRAIVIHGAAYVSDANVNQGRSWGCLALPINHRNSVIKKLKGGSLIYAGLSS